MGFVIAVSQAKGGSCKTTTSINLAGALIEQGHTVILADMDKDKPDAVRWAEQGNSLDFVSPLYDDKPMDALEILRRKYDFVILDTPPNYMPAAFKAIMLSDFVVLPCSPSFLDQNNLADAIAVPRMSQKPFRILGSKVQKHHNLSIQLANELRQSELAFETMISLRTAIMESAFEGKWIGDFAKNSDSHQEFLQLAVELVALLQQLKLQRADGFSNSQTVNAR